MSTIIANINFLASLGIVNQDEFVAAFGDMTTFDAYCREIGYSWEIDENNNIILYSPKNKEIDSGVSVLITEEPNIVVTEGEEAYTIEAIGNGTVKLYADDIEVSNPVVFDREDEAQEITFTATAQEDGKLISDAVEEDITIPAKLPVTDTPVITITPSDASYEISAQGSGVVKLYADGVQVSNPYIVTRTNEDQEFIFTATAKAEGHVISEEAEEEVVVPALPITDTPTISYDSATFTVNVTGNGTVLAYVDGVQTQMPHTFTQGESEQTYVVTATAQEEHKQISAVATMSCVVPAAMKKDYMKLSALGDGNITINIPSQIDTSYATSLSYSKDGSNWTDTAVDSTNQTITIPVSNGDEVYLKGIANRWATSDSYGYTTINSTANINASGNVMSLLYGDNFEDKVSFEQGAQYVLCSLFRGNTHLIDAGQLELPATTLGGQCYKYMFGYCSSLTTAPKLPATTLARSCYSNMFQGCSSLTSAPTLSATTLAQSCYSYMFNSCTSLTSAPELPATTLAQQCYLGMFQGCSSLTSAPELPATTLALSCYNDMFSGTNVLPDCSNIDFASHNNGGLQGLFSGTKVTDADLMNILPINPATGKYWLPATTLKTQCYAGMFQGCTSLTTAPALPATTLAANCYQSMFQGCTGLTSAPELPATTLTSNCYYDMFQGCSSLTSAPALPATTLEQNCYNSMFHGCTSLTTAPELPATTLADSCYENMFLSCRSLNSITMLATDISAKKCLNNWVSGVASSGTFTKAAAMTSLPSGASGIPDGWTIVDYGVVPNYMKLSALGDGNITITIPARVTSSQATSLSYSKDGSNWTDTAVDSTKQTITIPVSNGDEVYLKGIANQWAAGSADTKINSTANINASGNIMSLLYGDDFEDKTSFPSGSTYNLHDLFDSNTHLIDASELKLPATTLTGYCYEYMFYGCTSLTAAPKLPATTLAEKCYSSMFKGCSSLTTAPELPATTLEQNCYQSMFQGCSLLTSAPVLPATTLTEKCYYGMFFDCRSLNSITMLATNISATQCLNNWVSGVASSGTFTKAAAMTSLPSGASGIPDGWAVVDAA